ncbi:hypothetical protein ACIO6U_03070 [Streptomyces sp. NPDC087422]
MDRDPLSRLVREVNDSGVSFQKMADQSQEAAEPLSKPYFQKLAANNVTTPPTEARLRAIAAGLAKPLRLVQRAAAEQYMDYRTTELAGYDEETRIIVAHLAGMDPAARRRWRRMIEASEREPDDE